ncbi:MAG: hypothetical protein QNJ45_26025 [Ardenticatenaceae bacterium]|nr:hypothetical protein [Ardenticatenaceae bacterium]
MTRRRRPKWQTQLRKFQRQVGAIVKPIWQRTAVYNAVMIAAAALLFYWLLQQAFSAYFNCNYLIRDSLDMPGFVCSGRDFTVVRIPGLNSVMNGPLEGIRRFILWAVLFFFIVISGYATWIIQNMRKVVKLIKLDRQEWKAVGSTMRVFISILVLLNAAFFVYVMF